MTLSLLCATLVIRLCFAVASDILSESLVVVDNDCNLIGSRIGLSFAGSRKENDWLALIPVLSKLVNEFHSSTLTDDDYESWSWKCGNRPCLRTDGKVWFMVNNSTASSRFYVAALVQSNNVSPYRILATSSVFKVAASCPTSRVSPGDSIVEVRIAKRSFQRGQPIVVNFMNQATAKKDDFIAIYPAMTASPEAEDGILWKYLCNHQQNPCRQALARGSVQFDDISATWSSQADWPLQEGEYVSILMRSEETTGAFIALGQSEPFVVDSSNSPAIDSNLNQMALRTIRQARSKILRLIRRDTDLAPKFLRLIFHDCIGGCDGRLLLATAVRHSLTVSQAVLI